MHRTSRPDDVTGGVSGALGQAGLRGTAAWSVLRTGEAVRAPARRWPWLLAAALAGAGAGGAVAWGLRRVHTQDAPEAQEPEQLQAVVDRPDDRHDDDRRPHDG